MKTKKQQLLLPALAGLALICSASMALADDLVVNTFDSDVSGISWANFRNYILNYAAPDATWDSTQDADGNPSSGAMKLKLDWPTQSDPTWNQNWNDVQLAFYTPVINSADYINFEVDIKIDVANSSPALDGTYGAMELIVNNPWNNVAGWVTIAATGEWQHITGSFSGIPVGTYSEAVIGFISNGGSTLTNTVSYWIDNIKFTGASTVNTNRPALTLSKPPPLGLTCLSSQAGGTWQRQIIGTVNGNYSWNTATAVSNTTTYSMTITNFPSTAYAGYEARMYLINGLSNGQVDPDVDYHAVNCVYFTVYDNGDGSATGDFRYKVNNVGGGENYATLTNGTPDEYVYCASGALGAWSLAFNNTTNVTMTAPNGTANSFTIPPSDANYFQDPVYVYLGDRPNDNARIGQWATFNRFTITGAAGTPINDHFTNLDPGTWLVSAADPKGIIITTPDTKFWVKWPTPDAGFTNLFTTDNLANNIANSQWQTLPAGDIDWIPVGGFERLNIINQSTLNTAFGYSPTNCFLGLYHP